MNNPWFASAGTLAAGLATPAVLGSDEFRSPLSISEALQCSSVRTGELVKGMKQVAGRFGFCKDVEVA
jgi:hypothetical protein